MTAPTEKEIELHIRRQIKKLRALQGVTQTNLAGELTVSFLQVQKYERAANRLSEAKLYRTARFLKAPLAAFFEGLDRLEERDA